MSYVLGVDGGTSKTLAVVARMDGTIVGVGRRAGSNMYAGGEHLLANAVQASMDALACAGVAPDDVHTGVFSMSGADWDEDFDLIHATMSRGALCRHVVVVNDAVGGLVAGLPEGSGVAVICGTGVATAARNAAGDVWHTSFWQGAGGANDLSRKTLRAVYRAELGIDPPTALTAAVLDFFELDSVEATLHHLTARGGAGEVAYGALAGALLTAADGGDATARRIVETHGFELGEYALAAARKVGIEHRPFTLVLAGGVFRHASPLLVEALAATVRATSPGAPVVRTNREPVLGAVLLALKHSGVRIENWDVARLEALDACT